MISILEEEQVPRNLTQKRLLIIYQAILLNLNAFRRVKTYYTSKRSRRRFKSLNFGRVLEKLMNKLYYIQIQKNIILSIMLWKDLPVIMSEKFPQGYMNIIEIFDYIQIISKRIEKEKNLSS